MLPLALLLGLLHFTSGLQVQLSGEAHALACSLTNDGVEPLVFLVYKTPFDTHNQVFHGDIFDIRHSSGVKAVYSGIEIYRRPVISDFVTLRPGQTIETVLDLHKGYHFAEAGVYTVQLATNVGVYSGELGASVGEVLDQLSGVELDSKPVAVKVAVPSSPLVWPEFNTTGLLGGPSPKSNCAANQASQIQTSGNNAISASNRGYSYLTSSACSSSKSFYIRWFGACDNGRYSTVTNCLNSIHNFMRTTYPVDCAGSSCSANTYAYVYPTDTTRTIYVCAVFWKVTTANCVMDSQPGTLIHEASHFNNVCSTGDYAYGIANCENLARNNPANAIRNADNYCFYTDSCPGF
jgi:peptidyl-Lys metalloendopeptidase